ncbi:GapA-binding peptide SR1P [Fodinisporobacter ferrooxydans]|uniref:GapA-binding peptide SR1P n=1 Tax=Fodinisporobacter ferrooxydans TaxID=2901836 RepID=A0ABY4CIG6_9BACL|nr:GapA-binding peptide SR1P [Alicyclobacillaceae bacterium MYW30-H2]
MLTNANGTEMGTIICQHCHRVVETFETEKVLTYFGVCKEDDCVPVETAE